MQEWLNYKGITIITYCVTNVEYVDLFRSEVLLNCLLNDM